MTRVGNPKVEFTELPLFKTAAETMSRVFTVLRNMIAMTEMSAVNVMLQQLQRDDVFLKALEMVPSNKPSRCSRSRGNGASGGTRDGRFKA